MKKYGRRHSFPFILSLSLEFFAYTLRTRAAANCDKASGPMLPSTISSAEKLETSKRAKAFLKYFLRGPVWDSWTK
jgi:peroxin-16